MVSKLKEDVLEQMGKGRFFGFLCCGVMVFSLLWYPVLARIAGAVRYLMFGKTTDGINDDVNLVEIVGKYRDLNQFVVRF